MGVYEPDIKFLVLILNLDKDGSRYGRNTEVDFRYLSNYENYQKVVKKALKQLLKL